jgi:hypothetical protein
MQARMTIQSSAWAIEQQVPGEAKLVLLALANHADHTSGEVHFDAATISRESVVPEASLPRYLGALRRNGFLTRVEGKDGRRYWLQFDRDVMRPWSWDAEGDEASDHSERRTALVGGSAPSTFAPSRQVEARDEITAVEVARVAQGVPIIEGSDAFKAWCNHLRARRQLVPFVRGIILASGQERRGFYMPTLFPHSGQKQDEVA